MDLWFKCAKAGAKFATIDEPLLLYRFTNDTHKKQKPIYFHRAMQSIWDDQTLKPNEIVLVQDGKLTNDLYKIIEKWKIILGDILKTIPLEQNVGLGNALNIGLKECNYDFVARMDTDDICMLDRFEKQIKFFENNDVDIIGSYCIEVDEYGDRGNLRKMPLTYKDIYDNLFTCPLIHPTVMFKKSIIEKVGGYDKALTRRQDYDLWFKCAKAGAKFANIDEPLLLYRFTNDTHKKQNLNLMLSQAKIGYRGVKLLNQPYWKAITCYVPVIRSLLPNKVQHIVYRILKKFDPRQK